MEATGVYWKAVWNILSDGDFEEQDLTSAQSLGLDGQDRKMPYIAIM